MLTHRIKYKIFIKKEGLPAVEDSFSFTQQQRKQKNKGKKERSHRSHKSSLSFKVKHGNKPSAILNFTSSEVVTQVEVNIVLSNSDLGCLSKLSLITRAKY